ncbi:MAG TPA: HAD-IIIC family phosphatase [Bryobacteraceae bacterium]
MRKVGGTGTVRQVKLAEALTITKMAPSGGADFPVLLACGFTPLHLLHYLAAHLQKALPERKVRVETGLYDDVCGTLEQFSQRFSNEPGQTCALALEWPDLDPRLGYRQLGGWGRRVEASILESVQAKLARIQAALTSAPASSKIALSLPTLPLPPGFHTAGWQASAAELALREAVQRFAAEMVLRPGVAIVNAQRLDMVSPPHSRYDFRSDLHAGFPYTIAHADALGAALAALMEPPAPKKGLITDLDDTFWSGIVGEDGHENVSWDLAGHSQIHGLYQQMLHTLADHGVLIGMATKNSPEIAEKGLARPDLAIPREKIFPIEVHWEPKSGSVARILKTWNISADSVVFVDDSAMELEEVRLAHPGIECIQFPKSDYAAGLALLDRIRDLFGKPRLSDEDTYRLESIRQAQHFAVSNGTAASPEQFLAHVDAEITFEFNPPASDARVVELVNKTNQFNLNGIRYSDAEWHASLRRPGSFALAVSYRDQFGPLGKIAVLKGCSEGRQIHIETWVMSCRAFSRRIEQQTLAQIFHRFEAAEIVFDFKPTPKNKPIHDFLSGLLDCVPDPEAVLAKELFETKCPKLYHKVDVHG